MNRFRQLSYMIGWYFTFLFILSATTLHGQYRQNYGLYKSLPDSLLPKSKALPDHPIKKSKVLLSASPTLKSEGEYLLNQGWELASQQVVTTLAGSVFDSTYNTTEWYNATVPGTVLTTLVDQGVYPDPYMGINNMAIPDSICRMSWWYRLSFPLPAHQKNKRAWLHFDGINYRALFYLNGKYLGQNVGAFSRTHFDVTNLLSHDSKNILVVQILPPPNPGIPHEQSLLSGMGPNGGQLALDGPTFISSEGWDWVPGIRDRNMGIWQDVKLRFTREITIGDPQVITDLQLPDTTVAYVTIKVPVKNNSRQTKSTTIQLDVDQLHLTQTIELKGEQEVLVEFNPDNFPALKMKNPKLWWPNGYGTPYLYTASLKVIDSADVVSDQSKFKFGVREYSYEMMADAMQKSNWRFVYSPTDVKQKQPLFDYHARREFEKRIFIPQIRKNVNTSTWTSLPDTTNPYLVIRVNGVKVFCRGGNWGMDDGMKRVSKERLEPYFKLHQEANFNMIRNWTGESTQSSFYELADEYGLMVWNDFWISTEGYNLNPLDQNLFLKNTLDVIKRFRNHPSIAIWCPRNEGYAPIGIEDELYTQLMEQDGTRHYIGNSREINLRQSGDWHFIEDNRLYFTKYAEGFTTEIGTFSVPVASTIRKFIKKEDQWPISDAWHYHDLHSNNQNLQGYLKTVDSLYGDAKDLDDFSKKVQLVNYESHRAIYEAWNSKLWDRTSGVLLWMTHPAWPSMIWQTYSWDFETHGSYFGAKKACEPIHVQWNQHDNRVLVINTTQSSLQGLLIQATIFDLTGKKLLEKKWQSSALPNAKTDLGIFELSAFNNKTPVLIRLEAKTQKGTILSTNDYWRLPPTVNDFKEFNNTAMARLDAMLVSKNDEKQVWRIKNKSSVTAVAIKLNLLDAEQTILLPTYFSEGYFNLLPGEEKVVEVKLNGVKSPTYLQTLSYNSPIQQYSIK